MVDIGWPDLQCVLLTSILWPVNRRALWESIIRPPTSLPHPASHCPYHIILLVSLDVRLLSPIYNDPSMWGFSHSRTVAPVWTSQFATGSHPPISPL